MLQDIFLAITHPHPSLKDPIQRRVARMVAAFHLFTAPAAPIILLLDMLLQFSSRLTHNQILFIFALGLVDYALVRSKWYLLGIWSPIVAIGFIGPLLSQSLLHPSPAIFMLLVGIILAGVWVSMRQLWLVFGGYLFSIAAIASTATTPPVGGIILWLICVGLVFILRSHLNWSQAIRQKELHTHNMRLRSLLNTTFDGTAIAQNGRFTEVTAGFARVLATTPELLIGQNPEALLPPQMLHSLSEDHQGATTFLTSDGYLRYIQFVSEIGTEPNEYIFAIRDITQQQLQQAELQTTDRMVSAGIIAAGVAHEVNTPLMVIMSELELLQAPLSADLSLQPRLINIESNLERISDIMSDLKHFTRPNDSSTAADVNMLVESTLRLAQHTIGHKSDVQLSLTPCALAAISESKLSQVLLNLLLNAAQAKSPDKRLCQISIRTQQAEEAILIDIIDDGIGIPEAEQQIIFEPFFTTKPDEGTGLGLSICQRILTGCGGQIQLLKSSPQGSHFQISLPIAAPIEQPSASLKPTEQPTALKRILIIDDNPHILELLAELLEPNIIECHSTIQSGYAALQTFQPDIILCDLILPGKDGSILYHRLKNEHRLQDYHFVFITGGGVDSATQRFLDETQAPVLYKPFRIDDVWQVLESLPLRLPVY